MDTFVSTDLPQFNRELRLATKEDLPGIQALIEELLVGDDGHPETKTVSAILEKLRSDRYQSLVVCDAEGAIKGTISFSEPSAQVEELLGSEDGVIVELSYLFSSSSAARVIGAAQMLIDKACEIARYEGASCVAHAVSMKYEDYFSFYDSKFGSQVGQIVGYADSGRDVVVWKRSLV